ncbi:MAG: hypothetical protein MUC50_14115 [Myxococcota bacterium]|nr:hypothetical protein [Myxococcota bacterium]
MSHSRSLPPLVSAAILAILLLGQGGPAHGEDTVVHNYPGGNGLGLAGKLVVPATPGIYPLAVVSHGWSSSASNFIGWGKTIASLGFVVVVPSFPNPAMPDMVEDGKIIERLVDFYRNPPADSPAHGMVDPQALALVGHSGGGNSTALAAMTLQPAATVLFDPVDTKGLTKGRLDELCGPVLTIFSTPSGCNDNMVWEKRVTETTGPRRAFRVVGSTHCDGEKPPRAACGPFCGGAATPKAQAEYQRYLEAMLEAYVLGHADALALLDEAALSANPMLSTLSCDPSQASCVPLPWEEETDTEADTTTEVETDEPSSDGSDTTEETEEPQSTQSDPGPEPQETDSDGPSVPPSHELNSSGDSSCAAAHPGHAAPFGLLTILLFAGF